MTTEPKESPKRKPRKMQYYNLGPSGKTTQGATAADVMRFFGTNLQKRMIEKGWNQSELARQATLHSKAKRGVGRDVVSNYVRGRNLPSPHHLRALADALGCATTDLLPSGAVPSIDREHAPWRIEPTENGRVSLHVNVVVEFATAQKILALLREEAQ